MRNGRGFTLIELLVVIVIIIALAGIILPVLWKAKEHAIKTECKNNMKQIGEALMMYRDDHLATNKEWHPLWLRSLLADHLKDKECLICPADDTRGAQGGKPDGICQNQYNELNEGSSYMYEFNMAADCSWSWETDLTFPGGLNNLQKAQLIDIDGDATTTKWGEVKGRQLSHGDNWYNSQFSDGKTYHAYSPTMFPIVRCFWHTDEPDKDTHLDIHNLSYMCNFFRSGASWEKTSE